MRRFAVPTSVGVLVAIVLVAVIRPNSAGGTGLIVLVTLLVANAVGAAFGGRGGRRTGAGAEAPAASGAGDLKRQ